MEKVIAVIDIGMTNKKVAIYDRNLRMLDSVSRTFEPIMRRGPRDPRPRGHGGLVPR